MHVTGMVRRYVLHMVAGGGPGMKALLVDQHTIAVVGLVLPNSQLLEREVFLIRRLDAPGTPALMPDVKAIVFVRPSKTSLAALKQELAAPKFSQYSIYFSCAVSDRQLQDLASADKSKVVREVREVYADVLPLAPSLFSFNLVGCHGREVAKWHPQKLDQTAHGLLSLLKGLGRRPCIRYDQASKRCAELAEQVYANSEPDDHGLDDCVLLVLDRQRDPLTPLLNQWTYQAMVHEIFGLDNNVVRLDDEDLHKDLRAMALHPDQDRFFADNMFRTYPEVLLNADELRAKYKAVKEKQQNVETLEDMKVFFSNYSDFKAISESASKHISLALKLKEKVEQDLHLIDEQGVCDIEQALLTQADATKAFKAVATFLEDGIGGRDLDGLRLVLLFALRHPNKTSKVSELKELFTARYGRATALDVNEVVEQVLAYCPQGCTEAAKQAATGLYKTAEEVESELMQHTPLLASILDKLAAGRLKQSAYPPVNRGADYLGSRPAEVIVFIVGGATFEEAKTVAFFNQAAEGCQAILGGTTIHNTESFCEELKGSRRQ